MGLLLSTIVFFHHSFCDQNEAPTRDNEISQHPLLGGQALGLYWDDHTGRILMELEKLTDKIDKVHNYVNIINSQVQWKECLFICEYF